MISGFRTSFADLRTETAPLATLLCDRRHIVAATPAHHIYGFILTGFLSDVLGVDALRASGLSAGRLAAVLAQCDLIVTFPEKWGWIERSLPDFPLNVAGVVSTAPCPTGLVDAQGKTPREAEAPVGLHLQQIGRHAPAAIRADENRLHRRDGGARAWR